MNFTSVFSTLAILLLLSLTACDPGDIGPYEEGVQSYGLTNFDRLNMGSAFRITVRQGSAFAIEARGNQRDLTDLDIYTRNGTLYAQYRHPSRNRRYDMNLTITLPALRGVSFSGASRSDVSGFQTIRELDVSLSGASRATIDASADRLNLNLSGASNLDLQGTGNELDGKLSGASQVDAFLYSTNDVEIDLSGASTARVQVAKRLDVTASGASSVRYRGTPEVKTRLSGSSTVRQD